MRAPTRSPDDSLQRRLETRLLWRMAVLFLLSGALSYGITRYYVHEVFDRWLYDSANSLAQAVRQIGPRAGLDLPRSAEAMFQWDDEDQTVYRVVGSRSGYIAGVSEAPREPEAPEVFRNARLFDADLGGHAMRWAIVDVPLASAGEQVSVMVGETTRKRRHLAGEILLAVWIPQLVLLLLAGWVLHRVIFFQTRNILSLGNALRDMSHRSLQPVPENGLPAELRPLIEALNAVIGRLELAGQAQRAFIANAAHQLRTPLTALKLQAEQALRSESLPVMRISVVELQQSAQRAVRLANQLLLLSRAEPEAQSDASRDRVDLRVLAFEASREWVFRALSAGLDFGFDDASDHAWVMVDAALVREAVNNLLDNALKYCVSGARVNVSVSVGAGHAFIAVDDSGPGIEPADRERITQRFQRGNSVEAEGSGLGLAIVREIAKAHAGRLVVQSSALGGARFELHFPTHSLHGFSSAR
ncbi:sensor histidine kinase [Variovorax sp. PAMC28562]|uniref:sensor histidine kinase n=1 Tax=Variovorax sp. PAMC28562 TaxID=2762323 RepID=UPI00164DB06D|nr:sensor histidine kinase [Variovorax sp. PAMC28562]QNK71842.1 sensor histidine kinase [Variovorax sp. PAMC28562]